MFLGLGPFQGEQYVLLLRLVEVEFFIQIEVSDHCFDVQKLFSVIVETLCTKEINISAEKTLKIAELVSSLYNECYPMQRHYSYVEDFWQIQSVFYDDSMATHTKMC